MYTGPASAGVPNVRYEATTPRAEMNPYLARIWQMESTGSAADSPGRWSVPDGRSEWLFVLGDPLLRGKTILARGAHVIGVSDEAVLCRPTGRLMLLGAVFRVGCAAAALPARACRSAGTVVPLDDFWGPAATRLVDRLADANDFTERAALLQEELIARVGPNDAEVRDAVSRLESKPGSRIALLADGSSAARRLERKFLARVGMSPKRLARVLRLQSALALMESGAVGSWAEAAVAGGYSDQAHLTREFRAWLGTSPVAFSKRERQGVGSVQDEHGAVDHPGRVDPSARDMPR